MAKNTKVFDGTLPARVGKKKTMVERSGPKVVKRPKVIGNIEEIKANKVIKKPKIIGNLKLNSTFIKIPIVVKVDDKRKRYNTQLRARTNLLSCVT